MSTKTDTVALNDAELEAVNGGFDIVQQIENIGEATIDGFENGGKIGIYAGPPGVLAGAFGGAFYGALDGTKKAAAEGVGEVLGALKRGLSK